MLYKKVIQSYIYIYTFSFRFFSHIDYYRILGRVLYAIHYVFVGQSLYLSVHMPIPNHKSIPSIPLTLPFDNNKFFKVCMFLFCK